MELSRLAIRHLDLRLETEPGVAPNVAHEAIRTIRSGLAEKLSSRLKQDDGRDNDQILIIRRLVIDISCSAAMPLDDLVERLADAALVGIARVQGERKGGVFFSDRSAYVAAFLKALMDGSAWNRWWFGGFDGLRALPVSAAVRTVLSRNWGGALSVLAACPASLRARLWLMLAPADADIILEGLASGPPGPPDPELWTPLARAIHHMANLEGPVAALAILSQVAAETGHSGAVRIIPLIRRAAELRPLLADRARVESAIDQSARTIPLLRNSGDREDALAQLPAPLLQAMRGVLTERAGDSTARAGEHWRVSPLLGNAILLKYLHDLPLDLVVEDWPAPSRSVGAGPLIRLLILSACAGSQAQLWRDGVWRDLHTVPGTMRDEDIAEWTRGIGPKGWRTFLSQAGADTELEALRLPRALVPGRVAARVLGTLAAGLMHDLARRLPGFGNASPAFLRTNILGAGGSILIMSHKMRIRLERPPLDVLLGLTGLADGEIPLADGTLLTLERRS